MTGTANSESHAHTTLRPVRVQGVAERGPGSARGRRPRHGPRAPPYDRNKFLAANFSFLVSDGASLEAATADADMPLEWEDVLQVTPPTPPHLPLGSVRALASQSLHPDLEKVTVLSAGEHADQRGGADMPYRTGPTSRSADYAVW